MSQPAPISDLNQCIANIVAHATTVAASLAVPISDVARADPVPRGRCVRVWWGGEAAPPAFGGEHPSVLNGDLVGERVMVGCYWPIGDSSEVLSVARDKDVWTMANGLRAALQADSTLSGTCTDLDLAYTTNEYVLSNGALWRYLLFEISLSYIEYPTSL